MSLLVIVRNLQRVQSKVQKWDSWERIQRNPIITSSTLQESNIHSKSQITPKWYGENCWDFKYFQMCENFLEHQQNTINPIHFTNWTPIWERLKREISKFNTSSEHHQEMMSSTHIQCCKKVKKLNEIVLNMSLALKKKPQKYQFQRKQDNMCFTIFYPWIIPSQNWHEQ